MPNSVVKKLFLTMMLFMFLTREPTEDLSWFNPSCKPSCDVAERANVLEKYYKTTLPAL